MDILSVISIALLFSLSVTYVHGCDHLKGVRS